MAQPFIGQIRMFAGAFAPQGNAFCNGQLLQVSTNSALFALIGTTYGGDGQSTFALPDLRGRVPIHQGQGTGLTNRIIGQQPGTEQETIDAARMPRHTHQLHGSSDNADSNVPTGNVLANTGQESYIEDDPDETMRSESVTTTSGGGNSHTNVMPFQCLHFIIALLGVFPTQN